MSNHVSDIHWYSEPHPVLVGFGAGLFLSAAFFFKFFNQQGLIAIFALTLAVVMVLVGGVFWVNEAVGAVKGEGWSPSVMWIFFSLEALIIAGVGIAYWMIRASSPAWPPVGTPEIYKPIFATLFILLSSITATFAYMKQQKNDVSGFMLMTIATVVVWVGFSVLTMMSWGHLIALGFHLNTNAYAIVLYGMTGIHFAHIAFGLFILFLALSRAVHDHLNDYFTRSMSMYVHFVNLLSVWVLVLVFLW